MHAEAGADPVAGSAGMADVSTTVEVSDEGSDKPFRDGRGIGRDVVVDAIKVGLGRFGDDEVRGVGWCGSRVGGRIVGENVSRSESDALLLGR